METCNNAKVRPVLVAIWKIKMSQFPVLFPDTGAGNRWPHVIFFSQFPFSTLKPPNGFPKIGNGISSIFPKPLTKPAESQCYLKGARCHFHCSDLIALLLHYWRACGPSPHPTIQIFQGPLNIYIFLQEYRTSAILHGLSISGLGLEMVLEICNFRGPSGSIRKWFSFFQSTRVESMQFPVCCAA